MKRIRFTRSASRVTLHEIRSRNCNIFTIVGRREALFVKREATDFILMLTSWILMAFSVLAPKWEPAKMGTAWMRRLSRLFDSLPLDKFSPTSENSFLFPPYLLSTIYCVFANRPSYCNRNALHTATETPFTVQPKRPSYCNRNAPVPKQ